MGVYRAAVENADANVEAITAAASTILNEDVPALLGASRRAAPDARATLEVLFERVMREDMPILLPEGVGTDFGFRASPAMSCVPSPRPRWPRWRRSGSRLWLTNRRSACVRPRVPS